MRKKKFAARASSPSRNRNRLAVSKKSQLKSRLRPNRSRLQRLVVSKQSRLKSWRCPKRAAEKPAVSKQKPAAKAGRVPKEPAAKAGRVQTVYHVHHKEASAFFFLPSCISPASFRIFARKRLSFFVIFFGIFYVFLSWKDIQFSGVIFFAKKSRFRRLKNSAY